MIRFHFLEFWKIVNLHISPNYVADYSCKIHFVKRGKEYEKKKKKHLKNFKKLNAQNRCETFLRDDECFINQNSDHVEEMIPYPSCKR